MSNHRIKVMLVDDHAVVRMGFRLLLQGSPDIEVIGEAQSGEEAVAVSGAGAGCIGDGHFNARYWWAGGH